MEFQAFAKGLRFNCVRMKQAQIFRALGDGFCQWPDIATVTGLDEADISRVLRYMIKHEEVMITVFKKPRRYELTAQGWEIFKKIFPSFAQVDGKFPLPLKSCKEEREPERKLSSEKERTNIS